MREERQLPTSLLQYHGQHDVLTAGTLEKYASYFGGHGLLFVFFMPILNYAQMNHTNDLGPVLQHYSEINI
ncbi:hypothetical protein KUCAC02_028322 [Chaenocephalus aceratus]|uniref:Uncharacterized protein n=1 Tax=Chaenocephalus aceratus TaxID=36190 RepID=A0ACB9X2N9_CHAAC|nr:hypothetical protein KUCAC02_028322 [Chaenocephalus aceratus]